MVITILMVQPCLSASGWKNGDYLRLKNISLGYTFNTKNWASAIGISKLRVYAQVQNLFVITGYSGMDPEVMSNTTNATLAPGTDKNYLATGTYLHIWCELGVLIVEF